MNIVSQKNSLYKQTGNILNYLRFLRPFECQEFNRNYENRVEILNY